MAGGWIDNSYEQKPGVAVIYLAGGCFWGLQKLMQAMPGVVSAVSGYANGDCGEAPTYQLVCTGTTGFREAVRVEYDPEKISLDALLFAFFRVIRPEQKDAQGPDRGTQYQSGFYYADEASGRTVRRIADIERERHSRFFTEVEPIRCFYDAEDYHQGYLDRNPGGYCHIPHELIRSLKRTVTDPGDYKRPDNARIADLLTEDQYRVTQQDATEPPFRNAFWNRFDRGIYVDIVTGEPLFASGDKYESACGWPSFSAAIDDNAIVYLEDHSHSMERTEVRSRAGNSHLGHIFQGDRESPNGTRYCINSAALRFVPYEEMEAQGYGDLKRRLF